MNAYLNRIFQKEYDTLQVQVNSLLKTTLDKAKSTRKNVLNNILSR